MEEEELKKRGVSTHAGFPNAATGSQAKSLDFNRLLIPHPAATFLMELDSDAWKNKGMFAGDIVVIDRALDPKRNDLVIWWEADEFTFGKLEDVPDSTPVWGVVRSVIHRFKK